MNTSTIILASLFVITPMKASEPWSGLRTFLSYFTSATSGERELCHLIVQPETTPQEIRKLLELGTNPSVRDEQGKTALMKAANRGLTEIGALLIAYGAEIDTQDEYGWTALMYAVEKNNRSICSGLLDSGANMLLRSKSGKTALDYAAHQGAIEACYDLLRRGAPLTSFTLLCATETHLSKQESAAHEAIEDLCLELIRLNGNINAIGCDGRTALLNACEAGLTYTAIALIECGANIHAQIKTDKPTEFSFQPSREALCEGWTALNFAVHNNLQKVCKSLIKRGAKLNTCGRNGYTPLITAVISGNLALIKILIRNGADLYRKRAKKYTPLMHAVEKGDKTVCYYVLFYALFYRSAKKVHEAHERIKMRTLCLNRIFPRDILILILNDKNFIEDILTLVGHKWLMRKPIPAEYKKLLPYLVDYPTEELQADLRNARKLRSTNESIRRLLNVRTLKKHFGLNIEKLLVKQ